MEKSAVNNPKTVHFLILFISIDEVAHHFPGPAKSPVAGLACAKDKQTLIFKKSLAGACVGYVTHG
jgi:hypothetical protein